MIKTLSGIINPLATLEQGAWRILNAVVFVRDTSTTRTLSCIEDVSNENLLFNIE